MSASLARSAGLDSGAAHGPSNMTMKRPTAFEKIHRTEILGKLTLPDRVLFRGHLKLRDPRTLGIFLKHSHVMLKDFGAYTLLIAKRDPGQAIVWAAFAALITGLAITFYLPRRRVWARFRPDGRLDLVGRADRHVEFEREFDDLIDELVRIRR